MIITRTPLRISLFGGGTDFKEFYKKDYGAVLGFSINKYVNVIINKRFEQNVRASYSKTENVDRSSDLKHELIRESLLHMGIENGIEVVTVADVPGTGTGLGSSSSTLVGLLAGLSHYIQKPLDKESLARLACDIEINKIKSPIGKQDQYFAVFGGLSYLRFNADESVYMEKFNTNSNLVEELQNNILCFYTGIPRNSHGTLSEQRARIEDSNNFLYEIRSLADASRDLLKNNDLAKFGQMLHKGWELKKKLASNVTNDVIDSYYRRAIDAGALGGKISGAGGGGFLTLYCEKKYQQKVRESLKELKELEMNIVESGSSLIFPH